MCVEQAEGVGHVPGDELETWRRQLEQLEQDLAEFERRYGVPSAQFYAEYEAGTRGDAMDLIEWASLIDMADQLREQIARFEKPDNV